MSLMLMACARGGEANGGGGQANRSGWGAVAATRMHPDRQTVGSWDGRILANAVARRCHYGFSMGREIL